jgi:predicted DNA-binding antitoxin AbrB/MazE fold protein
MPVEAIYEQGTLRLSQPIKLAEGSKVQVIIIPLELSLIHISEPTRQVR